MIKALLVRGSKCLRITVFSISCHVGIKINVKKKQKIYRWVVGDCAVRSGTVTLRSTWCTVTSTWKCALRPFVRPGGPGHRRHRRPQRLAAAAAGGGAQHARAGRQGVGHVQLGARPAQVGDAGAALVRAVERLEEDAGGGAGDACRVPPPRRGTLSRLET